MTKAENNTLKECLEKRVKEQGKWTDVSRLNAELDTAKIEIRKYKELYNKASVEASLQFRAYADEIEKYQAKLKHLFRF